MAQEKREQERETINNNTMAINTFLNCNSEYIKCHGVAGGGGGGGGWWGGYLLVIHYYISNDLIQN